MNFFKNPEYSSIRIILLIVIIAGAGYFIVSNLSDRGVGEQTGKVYSNERVLNTNPGAVTMPDLQGVKFASSSSTSDAESKILISVTNNGDGTCTVTVIDTETWTNPSEHTGVWNGSGCVIIVKVDPDTTVTPAVDPKIKVNQNINTSGN